MNDDYRIIIPVFNGEKIIYDALLSNRKHLPKIIVVDDGSTDGTLKEIRRFQDRYGKVHLIKMQKNAKKVGAVRRAVETLPRNVSYVMATDDDSTVVPTPERLKENCKNLKDGKYAAASFRMLPLKTSNFLEKLQLIEYELANSFRKILGNRGKQRCIEGAGGLFKKDVLLEALRLHSGKFGGDDFETTLIIQELGHRTCYFGDLVVKTNVPKNLMAKLKQKSSWETGTIRVYAEKMNFILGQIFRVNRLGMIFLLEMYSHIALPLTLAWIALSIFYGNYLGLLIGYIITLTINTLLIHHSDKNNKLDLLPFLAFPWYFLFLTMHSRLKAYIFFIKKRRTV